MQMEASPDDEDAVALEIKSDIQLILSVLCESDMHRKVKLRLRPREEPEVFTERPVRSMLTAMLCRTTGAVWIRGSRDGGSLPEERLKQVLQRSGTQQAHPLHGGLCVVSSDKLKVYQNT